MQLTNRLWQKAIQFENHYAKKYSFYLGIDKDAYVGECGAAEKALKTLEASDKVINGEAYLNKTIKNLCLQYNRTRIEELENTETTAPEFEVGGDGSYEDTLDKIEEDDNATKLLQEKCEAVGVEYVPGMSIETLAEAIADKNPSKKLDMKIISIIGKGITQTENIINALPDELLKPNQSKVRQRVAELLESNFGIVKNQRTIAAAVRQVFKRKPDIKSHEFQVHPLMRRLIFCPQLRADYYKKYSKKMRDGDI